VPKVKYKDIRFSAPRLAIIDNANAIIEEYESQGFVLTLRQLYYQFVSRALIANKQSEYKRLGDIINDARLAGKIDWLAITDRTRNLTGLPHWDGPEDIVSASANHFHLDKWKNQDNRIEVWIEKDALAGVIEGVCKELDVPFFSCRGYTSQSEMWVAARRLIKYDKAGQAPVILHLGDHDPSGIDMSRDIEDRIALFTEAHRGLRRRFEFRRLALNMDQVEKYNPPPNPAKTTDARYAGYQAEHGDESWELDALEPKVLADLIRENIEEFRDEDQWSEDLAEEDRHKEDLSKVASNWALAVEHVRKEEEERGKS